MQQVIKKMSALLLSMLLCVVVLAGCATPKVVEDNRPTGEYDWDYIASLLRADEVTPEEVDDLARLYSAMTPKDMERFFAAGCIPCNSARCMKVFSILRTYADEEHLSFACFCMRDILLATPRPLQTLYNRECFK